MKQTASDTFTLDNFEGPLDLLWYLVTSEEIDIYEVPVHKLTNQYLLLLQDPNVKLNAHYLDKGAEFIGIATALLWLKSKTLLPKEEEDKESLGFDEDNDPNFSIIHHLIDYCRYKQAAKLLKEKEYSQAAFYPRGKEESEIKKSLGIHHLSLDDLALLFKQILAKAAPARGVIYEDTWKVSDKISAISHLLNMQNKIQFYDIFKEASSREELITIFLALLELMKLGIAHVIYHPSQNIVFVQKV